ncbi:MAG: serine/threonine-protein kinase [Myxococcota bacterium]
MVVDPDFPPGKLLLGRYRLTGTLAKGGMSVIHRGDDEATGTAVAVKVLPQELNTARIRQRFLREARLAAQVSHPNVVTTYDAGFEGERPFLVMELLEGETLFHRLRDHGPLPIDEALLMIMEVLKGVGAAHEQGVVHRDLKPSNVLLLERGGVKVIDFGLSKDLQKGSGSDITRPHEALGTPSYMSPEQVLVEPVDERTDIYGVGVVLYETLTGHRAVPKEDGVVTEIFKRILEVVPPPPSAHRADITAVLDDLVMKAITKDPNDRFQSTGEMLAACEGL